MKLYEYIISIYQQYLFSFLASISKYYLQCSLIKIIKDESIQIFKPVLRNKV